ncbi:hypothetical protein EON67_04185 [archaeon]|nr:MAG: hypothetical protein EON67_04185 [archaeon]
MLRPGVLPPGARLLRLCSGVRPRPRCSLRTALLSTGPLRVNRSRARREQAACLLTRRSLVWPLHRRPHAQRTS